MAFSDLSKNQDFHCTRFLFNRPPAALTPFFCGPTSRPLHVAMDAAFDMFPTPSVASLTSSVPFLYLWGGRIQCRLATWGIRYPSGDEFEQFRLYGARTLGYPGLIPVTKLEFHICSEQTMGKCITANYEGSGDDLLVASIFSADAMGNVRGVVPLMDRTADGYSPLFVQPAGAYRFLTRRDLGRPLRENVEVS